MMVPGLQKQFAFSWLLALHVLPEHHARGPVSGHLAPFVRCPVVRAHPPHHEHLACSAPIMAVFFLPILVNALVAGPEKALFAWMHSDGPRPRAVRQEGFVQQANLGGGFPDPFRPLALA
jgi:hypothetical protein